MVSNIPVGESNYFALRSFEKSQQRQQQIRARLEDRESLQRPPESVLPRPMIFRSGFASR
jgi:hypothetical protein